MKRPVLLSLFLAGAAACDGALEVEPIAALERGVVIVPGCAAIFGFQGGTGGGQDSPQLGPNDRQLVGDFRGLGRDQVLFLKYWGGTRRTVLADFEVAGGLGDTPLLERRTRHVADLLGRAGATLTGVIVGDFDSLNNHDDLFWQSGNEWMYSSRGRAAAALQRTETLGPFGSADEDYSDISKAVWATSTTPARRRAALRAEDLRPVPARPPARGSAARGSSTPAAGAARRAHGLLDAQDDDSVVHGCASRSAPQGWQTKYLVPPHLTYHQPLSITQCR